MDPYYSKSLSATFLNYMNQRQEQKANYDITSQIQPDLSFPKFPELTNLGRDAQAAHKITGAV